MAFENHDIINNDLDAEDTANTPNTVNKEGLDLRTLTTFSQKPAPVIIRKPLSSISTTNNTNPIELNLDVNPVVIEDNQAVDPNTAAILGPQTSVLEDLKQTNLEQAKSNLSSDIKKQWEDYSQNLIQNEVTSTYDNYYSGFESSAQVETVSAEAAINQAESVLNNSNATEAEIASVIMVLELREDKDNSEIKAVLTKLYDKQADLAINAEIDNTREDLSSQISKLESLLKNVSDAKKFTLNARIVELKGKVAKLLTDELKSTDLLAA